MAGTVPEFNLRIDGFFISNPDCSPGQSKQEMPILDEFFCRLGSSLGWVLGTSI